MSKNDRENFIIKAEKLHDSLNIKEKMVDRLNQYKFFSNEYKSAINTLLSHNLSEIMPMHKLIALFKDLKDANLVTTDEMDHFGISEDNFTTVHEHEEKDIAPPIVNALCSAVRSAVQQQPLQKDFGYLTASSSTYQNTANIQKEELTE